jgi:acylpyruvate hydrolase
VRLVTYASGTEWLPGIVRDNDIINLNEALVAARVHSPAPIASIRAFLEEHGGRLGEIGDLLDSSLHDETIPVAGNLSGLRLGPPVKDPRKVLCVGLNYSDHVGETGRKLPTHPDIFCKFDSSLIGPNDTIARSEVSANLDFEGELAVVIGRPCHRVPDSEGLSYVAGVSVLNDITARDLQYRGTQWLPGKALDSATPFGPWVTTVDEVGDPQSLDIQTLVNGVQMQSSNTKHMIFPIAQIVSYVSQFLTLMPGDVIATGTPEGIGAKRQPPSWLRPGDSVEVIIERVGTLSNDIR